ncbi:MAG: homoserine O-acetyltransferase MetA [Kurthia gibsonii]|uniref:Homoserine O-acetyltransferase n=1 Tax=Kurthia gibsonii TaxID=33946 RepID=A0ABU9LMC9_9BACL|nr:MULTISPECIES: homoserine O-succinyltransferase [Kurthia]MCA9724573.1 homoserine O-succinyltransferase [Kurthia sp.]AMA64056.1 homoserine O-succinyltransferase [Kurthia sp. 11kri321]MEB6112427.1 homoserine O-succinyltransferase [Kurthia gibsonii]RXH51322.1 homoserine O-succinyltransferase [Kurthia gibsonii]WIL39875.1 homoserine O-succinyltransferase [Kurthia sp. YJT4]
MPINIPSGLPATEILKEEKIFIMDEVRSTSQNIRPLNILIFNLMPEKEKTELQLLRLLGNTPLQVNVTFLNTATHESKNVSKNHLESFYTTFEHVKHRKFDGMIITGAPIELFEFHEVDFWDEMVEIMEWTKTNVTSVLNICWGAQAALYYHYGIGKYTLPSKCSGVFDHIVHDSTVKLIRGFNDVYTAPHSRNTSVSREAILNHPDLELVSESDEAGAFIIVSRDEKQIMITGHLEYDADTLKQEYDRDVAKGIEPQVPKHYFPNDDPTKKPLNRWRSHTHLLFSNWLNYYVYQETPYEWE